MSFEKLPVVLGNSPYASLDTDILVDFRKKHNTVFVSGDTSTRTTRATAVQAAIDTATAGDIVFVPNDFLNYDASAVTFDNSIRMVREGQITGVYDVGAYGAEGDGVVDDTAAIQAAIDASIANGGGLVDLGEGELLTTSVLTLASKIILFGRGKNATQITNDTGDIFTWSTSVDHALFIDFKAVASAGHVFNAGAGFSQSNIIRCWLQTKDTASSVYHSVGNGYIDILVDQCTLWMDPSATVPAWNLVSSTNAINSNTWRRSRINGQGSSEYFFHIEENSGTSFASDNVFQDITGEIVEGGIIDAYSVNNLRIENVVGYDGTTYENSLFRIQPAAGGGNNSRNVVMINCGRRGGALGVGAFDVEADSNTFFLTIINCGPISGTPSYSVPTNRVVILGSSEEGQGAHLRSATVVDPVSSSPSLKVLPKFGSGDGLHVEPGVGSYGADLFTVRQFGDADFRYKIDQFGKVTVKDGAGTQRYALEQAGALGAKLTGDLHVTGQLGVGNSAAATTPGSVQNKIEVFDEAGNSLGFIAVYDAIT